MRSISRALAAVCIVVAPLAASAAEAQPRTFTVDGGGASQVQFVSEATLETFTGRTKTVSGKITVDPGALAKAKAEIKVDVASIDTNIALRNEHLASDKWLDAKKFPHARFVVTGISGAAQLKANDTSDVSVKGKFTIHGVTKEMTVPAKVRWTTTPGGKGDSLRIQATFVIPLEAHKVSIPSIVALKVSPNIKVNIDLRATAP